jgi:CRISPR/Cas system CSM-associated protein Csm3 (group 7 of RAMP superfamily)
LVSHIKGRIKTESEIRALRKIRVRKREEVTEAGGSHTPVMKRFIICALPEILLG